MKQAGSGRRGGRRPGRAGDEDMRGSLRVTGRPVGDGVLSLGSSGTSVGSAACSSELGREEGHEPD